MEWHAVLQAVLSLIFVIGLLLLTLWLMKYCELKGLKCKLVRNLKAAQRLEIIETRRLDTKNTMVLLRCDNTEHLILLGATSNLLLENHIQHQDLSAND